MKSPVGAAPMRSMSSGSSASAMIPRISVRAPDRAVLRGTLPGPHAPVRRGMSRRRLRDRDNQLRHTANVLGIEPSVVVVAGVAETRQQLLAERLADRPP